MCRGCWEEAGEPKHRTPAVVAAAKLVEQLYESEPAGGNLHIAVDDWNLEDRDLDWCRDHAEGGQLLDIERQVYEALRALSLEGRQTALAIQGGYLAA